MISSNHHRNHSHPDITVNCHSAIKFKVILFADFVHKPVVLVQRTFIDINTVAPALTSMPEKFIFTDLPINMMFGY